MTTSTRSRIASLVMQIQSAFLDNAMLSLTLHDARRRFGVDEVACAAVLGTLVDARVLTKEAGVYRRNFPRFGLRPSAWSQKRASGLSFRWDVLPGTRS